MSQNNIIELNKNYEKSIQKYLQILKSDKNNTAILSKLAESYQKAGRFDEATNCYLRIKHLTPFDKTIYYKIGLLEYDKKNYQNAVKNFIRAIKLSADYYDAIYALAKSHEAQEEYDMAEMIYLKIINNRPSYILAYNRLANLYIKIKNYKKAIEYFKALLAINPEFHRAYLGLAIACDEKNYTYEAKKYFKKYLEYKPFSQEKNYIMERLEQMRQPRLINNNKPTYLALVK